MACRSGLVPRRDSLLYASRNKTAAQSRSLIALAAALLAAALPLSAAAATRYVDLNSPGPTPPYTNWFTAAHTIQDAIDAAATSDTILVTNGIYATGGRPEGRYALTNRVMIDKSLTVRSVNGPLATIIQGYQVPGTVTGDAAVRCAYVTNGAVLSGFTLTGGATRGAAGDAKREEPGGGAYCVSYLSVITNCVIIGNTAYSWGGGSDGGSLYNCVIKSNAASAGGGAYLARLYNCLLAGNTASNNGGGAVRGTLNNCTITANTAGTGAGGYNGDTDGILNNCIVFYNAAPSYPNYYRGTYNPWTSINNCCLYPSTPYGSGNIATQPAFVNASEGDFRLAPESLCINGGNNIHATNSFDLAGNPRILNGTVDIGAYECRPFSSFTFTEWLEYYRLPADGSVDMTDTDGDYHNNSQEWVAGTNPTNAASVLKFLASSRTANGFNLQWLGVKGKTYTIEYAVRLAGTLSFQPWRQNIAGQQGTNTATFPLLPGTTQHFFRIRLQ